MRPASIALVVVALLTTWSPVAAHEIPSRVTVLAFVKPEPGRLRVLLRAPLESMRDIDFPLRGPGYLDIERSEPLLRQAARVWLAGSLSFYEENRPLSDARILAVRISLPADRSFASYDSALAHITRAPRDTTTALFWKQALVDVAIEYPIGSATSRFSLDPTLARLGVRTTTVLRFLPPNGAERAYEYVGDPGLVRLDPRWHQAALRFVSLGFHHILDGIDHLLFVFCLVIPFRRFRPLVAIITSFTVAHCLTLAASVLGFAPDALWFPPLIEVLIALSIVYMAFENIVGPKLERRWLLAFGFGLVHGFGFSFALRESLQFAGTHLATSLLTFNLGVELGQLLVLAIAIPALTVLFKHVVAERMGTILLSALVAHTAWHWMLDRATVLGQYRFQWPSIDASFLLSTMRLVMLLLIVIGLGWMLSPGVRRLAGRTPMGEVGAE
ncbi:MAG TPA: HupE/UreJ family protein [Gemmatimonadaceae bacterium]|nr:HupE/UreJ family protein [Gemmatimonadaceae bacterium]